MPGYYKAIYPAEMSMPLRSSAYCSRKVFSDLSTARAIRSRAPLRSSSWSGSLTSGVGDETASRVESVMAYPFLLVVIVLVINQQDTPLFQIAPYTRNEHSSPTNQWCCTSRLNPST